MNGNADQLATADYASELVEPTETTEQRLTRAARLAERCVDLYARQATGPSREPTTPPDAQARALEQIADSFHGSSESLHKAPSRVRLSPDTNAAIESVCTAAAVAAEACANPSSRCTREQADASDTPTGNAPGAREDPLRRAGTLEPEECDVAEGARGR